MATIPTMCRCTRAWTTAVYRRPWRDSSAGRSSAPAAGFRSAASWRWLSTPPALATTRAAGRSSAACLQSGSDFVTAPELSPLFGRTLARQLAQALDASGSDEIWEFGAGSGALAVRTARRARRSGAPLFDRRGRQRRCASASATRPAPSPTAYAGSTSCRRRLRGVVIGNEVLDAMPVELIHFDGVAWHERGVVRAEGDATWPGAIARASKRPPVATPFPAGSTTELHEQARAFVATLADRLARGAIFLIDYGFPEAEYYHPQRSGGTLMCHRAHRADTDPAGRHRPEGHHQPSRLHGPRRRRPGRRPRRHRLHVAGAFPARLRLWASCSRAPPRARASTPSELVHEHEMGELFKVLAFAKGVDFRADRLCQR